MKASVPVSGIKRTLEQVQSFSWGSVPRDRAFPRQSGLRVHVTVLLSIYTSPVNRAHAELPAHHPRGSNTALTTCIFTMHVGIFFF